MKSEGTGTVLGTCGFKVKSFHARGLKITSVTYVTEVLVVRGPGAAEPGGSGSGPLGAGVKSQPLEGLPGARGGTCQMACPLGVFSTWTSP